MAEIIKLGTFLLGGKPAMQGASRYPNMLDPSFGDTVLGKEISWVRFGDRLVADRCLCKYISWDKLNDLGFVFGTRIWIDGQPYICRCPYGGTDRYVHNSEWDALAAEYSREGLWCRDEYFWCQESFQSKDMPPLRVVRGCLDFAYFGSGIASESVSNRGFLPVLEPYKRQEIDFRSWEGKEIYVSGPCEQTISGRVIQVDDYDLLMFTHLPLPSDCWWAAKEGQYITVPKDRIWGVNLST